MMRGTMIMVGIAAVALTVAIVQRPETMAPPTFEDTGEALFPDFEDPNAAAFLEVKAFSDEQARMTAFSVKLENGVWVIPSHNNYPADGTERMGKAAASFLGAKKDTFRSDDPKDHAEFGVVDPEDADATEESAGQHVTIKDGAGTTLVDVIVGKDVPDKQGYKFVRYPGENRVYASQLAPEISTSFTDWIEKDLLKLETDDIVAVVSNSYSVDEQSGTVTDDNPIYFEYVDTGAIGADGNPLVDWTVGAIPVYGPDGQRIDPATYAGEVPLPTAYPVPEGKELNPTKVKQIVGAADRMKIVGVRPQPQQLSALDLLSKGFFVGGEPPAQRLFGNEGEVRLYAKDGVVYTLYFGEVTYAAGEALTAGNGEGEDEQAGDTGGEDGGESDANRQANRYMFVAVGYDPRRDENAGEPPTEGELRGAQRAEALAERFNRWYYVIPDSSFTQVHKVPDDFWRDLKAE